MTTTNTVTLSEIPVDPLDPTRAAWGPQLATQYFFVLANGTAAAEQFDPADISQATRLLMAQYGRGISVALGGGGDTASGTDWGDAFSTGAGVNRIDGGADLGTAPDGSQARDVLNVIVASNQAAAAIRVTALDADASGADGEAYAAGYRVKVANGSQTDYLKNVEQVNVFRSDAGNAFQHSLLLAPEVRTIAPQADLAAASHFAWVAGTEWFDSFDAGVDIPDATRALMAQHGRGVYIDLGAGGGKVAGSAYGDAIVAGSGVESVDGGAGHDVLLVRVATPEEAAAVRVDALAPGAQGADGAALAEGYTHKVVTGSGSDYIRNIERIAVQLNGDAASGVVTREIPLARAIREATSNETGFPHLAWIDGTSGADSLRAADLVSDALAARMRETGKGVWIDGGAGDDIIVGSAQADTFRNGAGNARIDGGANAGGDDVFEIAVDSVDAMAAVRVRASDDPDYDWMVSYGSGDQKDYLRNVESVLVTAGGNSRSIALDDVPVRNSAPTFAGAPPGVVIDRSGLEQNLVGGTVLADGKLLSLRGILFEDGRVEVALVRNHADGRPDTTYGVDGRVALPSQVLANTNPVQQPDGKVLVALATQGPNFDVRVLRLNADGSLDTGFGDQGSVVVSLGANSDLASDILLMADGRIVVTATDLVNGGMGLGALRLLADGSLDTSFNGSGMLQFSPRPGQAASSSHATLQQDGKLLIVGLAQGSGTGLDFAITRIGVDGRPDTSFGNGGSVVLPIGPGTDNARAVVALEDGKILVAGTTRSSSNDVDSALLRLNADGSLDASFGSGGIALARLTAGHDLFSQMAVQDDGKIVVLGSINGGLTTTDGAELMVARYHADGRPDTAFGNNGIVHIPGNGIGTGIDPGALEIVDGRIIVFANTLGNPGAGNGSSVLARIDSNGRLDPGFNPNPLSSIGDSVTSDGVGPTVLDRDAAIYDADMAARGHYDGASLTLARQGGASASDRFSAVGEVSFANGVLAVGGTAIGSVTQAGGILTLVFDEAATQGLVNRALHGIAYANTDTSAVAPASVPIAWTFSDGELQASAVTEVRMPEPEPANTAPTFAGVPAGVAVDNIGVAYSQLAGSVTADGKLLSVRGLVHADDRFEVILARHNADGSIDTGFGDANGRLVLDTGGINLNPAPLELPDGKIMLAVSTPGSPFDFRIMRLNPDGNPDTSFGDGGSVVVDVDPGSDLPTEMLLQPDGKVIVAGTRNVNTGGGFVVATRLNEDGSLDTSFGVDGRLAYSPPGVGAVPSHVALQADGKLLAVGFTVTVVFGSPNVFVARFDADGALDTAFAEDGMLIKALGSANSNARAVHELPDGKILVAGTMRSPASDADGFLMRLHPDGTLDTAFGAGGVMHAHLTDGHDVFAHMVVQPDGKIVVLGTIGATSTAYGMGGELMLVRYHADGRIDFSFGEDGIAVIPGHGIAVGRDPGSLALVDGKFVVFGTTTTDLALNNVQPLLARVNADGTLDASFNPDPRSSIGDSVRFGGAEAVVLDANAAIHDAELHARGDYGGASLTLMRQDGAAPEDVFSALGEVSFANGLLTVGGIAIGSASQDDGVLRLDFNDGASQGLVNRAMHGIGYQYDGETLPTSIHIEWIFEDGEGGAAVETTEVLVDAGADVSGLAPIELVGLPHD